MLKLQVFYMKKYFLLTVLTIFTFIFTACNFQLSGTNYVTKPDVSLSTTPGEIIIAIPKLSSSTQYINIYRKKSDAGDSTILNIGILYPDKYPTTETAYIFKDNLVVVNQEYVYRIRYRDEEGYTTSNWSDKIASDSSTYTASDVLAYGTAGFYYAEDTCTLEMDGTPASPSAISNFSTEYNPMLIISTSSKTQLFAINSVADGELYRLKSFLPEDFYDTPITIVGILAEKKETDSSTPPQVKCIHFTEPTEIPIQGYSDRTFTVSTTSSSSGVDYSRAARTK